MRTFTLLLSALVLGTTAITAQTVATFDTLHLSKADTFYVNYSASGTDVGFDDGHAHFPCIYDTSYGGLWSSGFAYSNMTDSVTSGYFNQYSAKTAKGYGGSANYVVAHCSDPITFAPVLKITLTGAAAGKPVKGFYTTNNTYAYNSMRDGDGFAKKFVNGDWFLLSVQGYSGGVLQPATVGVYLADFLYADPSKNFILNTWQWVDLLPLGPVDSLQLSLSSSDNGMFGMNTPAYFCMDNFSTNDLLTDTSLSVKEVAAVAARVYPNPATNSLFIAAADNSVQQITVINSTGRIMGNYEVIGNLTEITTSTLPAGVYMLQLTGAKNPAAIRFIKE
jgi:hypothetical protein